MRKKPWKFYMPTYTWSVKMCTANASRYSSVINPTKHTHDNLEHLATMETVVDSRIDTQFAMHLFMHDNGRTDHIYRRYFKRPRLDHLTSDTTRGSRRFVKATRSNTVSNCRCSSILPKPMSFWTSPNNVDHHNHLGKQPRADGAYDIFTTQWNTKMRKRIGAPLPQRTNRDQTQLLLLAVGWLGNAAEENPTNYAIRVQIIAS
ncbi:uncharacterized protein TRIVIDRAFT_62600 [Trichoderma virens Gv29-8]|uniref:Uncharacterized protein n=1 Tax=Hypocrea virens (strain Gv29-8 / FGSC 10586) TaxID=413071 RepID=G9MFP8_HYPVG|nr:uncharacterized protein TRIVIDRAFT_62600 [Trichoderma virens Gv29-8]EHK26795.1 hypothetical protein TRIVIDRAFT_62600 [Trichoderma virens Gv29-8]UKZ57248.1 hypothetical protein TrVGV298_011101 [Trichoderma virens]